MNEALKIRLATVQDAPIIASMSRQFVEYGLGWSWTPIRLARTIRETDCNVIVAMAGNSIAGFAVMFYAKTEAHLNLFAVHPEFRRQGVGSNMISWLEKTALINGNGTIYLEVRSSNLVARKFYHSLGYCEIQELSGYYQGRESAIRMAHDLWSAVPPG